MISHGMETDRGVRPLQVMNNYTFLPNFGIIDTLNKCPGDATNIPGRDMTNVGSHVRLLYFISSRLANGQEDFLVDKSTAVQGELFSESSKHHSSYALRKRHNELRADVHQSDQSPGRPVDDLTGERFGRLLVVALTDERYSGSVVYLCRCDCGTTIKQPRNRLKSTRKAVTHCGCQGVGKGRKPKPGALTLGSRYSQQFAGGKKTSALSPLKGLFANYRYGAAKRGYDFNLTLAQFNKLLQGDCYYCGSPPTQEYGRSDNVLHYNGIDRVDNDRGYIVDNCISCCGQCNNFKGTLPQSEFRQLITSIYNHWIV